MGAKDLGGSEELEYGKEATFGVCICLVHVELFVLALYTDTK